MNTQKKNSITETLKSNVEHLKNKRKAEQEKVKKKSKKAREARESLIDFASHKLRSDILRFREEGFIIVCTNDLISCVPEHSVSEGAGFLKSWKDNPMKIFFRINTVPFFELITKVINDEMIKTLTVGEIADSSKKYYRKTNLVEVIQFFGIYILIDNSWGNENRDCAQNFAKLKKKEQFDMGQQRFFVLRRSIVPSNEIFDQLVSMWVKNSQNYWTPGPQISVDETIFAYQVKSETKEQYIEDKDPAPVHYIPRKPHPNGLFAWVAATKSNATNKPFVLDIIPHYKYSPN
jgi:hypothetical protein